MKAITLYQPWATLVAIEAKRIETRSWSTKYRGPLAIHAGKNEKHMDLCFQEPFLSALRDVGLIAPKDTMRYAVQKLGGFDFPLGCVVAVANLYDCVKIEDFGVFTSRGVVRDDRLWFVPPTKLSDEYAFGDYTPGRYAWLLGDVKPCSLHYRVKGAMGLWEWDR